MKPGDLKVNAETFEADYPGQYGLSFWSWPGLADDEIARRVPRKQLPHQVIRKLTAGKIRALVGSDGQPLTLEKTRGPGHYTLWLPSPPTDEDYSTLSEAFDPIQPNPALRSE